jgi:hypothetical protein
MIYEGSCHCGKVSGSLSWFVPRDKLRLLNMQDDLGSKGNPMAAINIRCLPAVELASVPVKHFDGKSL